MPVQNSHLCYEEHAACLSANALSCGGDVDTENGATSGRKQPGRERLWGWVMAQGGSVVMETSRRCGLQSLLHPIHKELSPHRASVRLWGGSLGKAQEKAVEAMRRGHGANPLKELRTEKPHSQHSKCIWDTMERSGEPELKDLDSSSPPTINQAAVWAWASLFPSLGFRCLL